MNSELPPLGFTPIIGARRRERPRNPQFSAIPADQRRAIAVRIHAEITAVKRQMAALSPEARRAVFLKLRHDRPITKADLSGTGLVLVAAPSEHESLVAPKTAGEIDKLEERIGVFAAGDEPGRPKGTELATNISSIQVADPKDRLSDSMAVVYDNLSQQSFIKYEMEAASFESHLVSAKREVADIISEIRRDLAGIHGSIYEHETHERGARILLWSSGAKLVEFVTLPRWQRKITFFDERPRFETFHQVLEQFSAANAVITPPPLGAETICVIDSGVAAGNPFLSPVIRADISRSFVSGYSPLEDACGHGSGVASLAAFYPFNVLQGAENEATAFIASARIMNDEGQLDAPLTDDLEENRRQECRLLSTLLREIVEHFTQQGVRVFVLSFQITGNIWSQATQRYIPRNTWVARTLDSLSREHDVIFVTITGNIDASTISDLLGEAPYPEYLHRTLAKLLDPGHSALSITAGSIANSSTVTDGNLRPIALVGHPSPFTRSGPGFGNAIKPDFVEYGGNLVYDPQMGRVLANVRTNVLMASGKLTPPLQNNNGTSFAAPRVAHHLAVLNTDLRENGIDASAPLLRAFLASSARPASDNTDDINLSGYGMPNGREATECREHSAILYWQGNVLVDKNALFRIPVPVELANGGRGKKRIVVAVASAPPVQAWGVSEYLGAEMKFRLFRGDTSYEEVEAALQRDDDEENIAPAESLSDMGGSPGITARSAGTLQRAVFEWQIHNPDYSVDDYTLGITLIKASWAKANVEIPLGVVIRIEDTTEQCVELYGLVRAKVRTRARA